MLNFLMNDGIMKDIIKLWFSLGVFLLQPTLEQRMLQREEMSEVIESSLPIYKKLWGKDMTEAWQESSHQGRTGIRVPGHSSDRGSAKLLCCQMILDKC